MKRKICFFLALLTLFLSSSCGKKPSETEPETTFKPASTTTEREDDPDFFDFSDKEGERNVFVTGEDILVLFNEAKEYCERYGTIRGKIISNSYEGDKWTGENRARPLEYIEETINPNRETIALFNQGKYEELSPEQFVKCVDDIMTVLMMNITSFCDPGIIFSEYPSFVKLGSDETSGKCYKFGVRYAVILRAQSSPEKQGDIISNYEKAVIKILESRLARSEAGSWLGALVIYREGQMNVVCPTNEMTGAINKTVFKEWGNEGSLEYLDLRKATKEKQRYATEDDIAAILEKSKQDYLDHNAVFGEIVSNSYKSWTAEYGYAEGQKPEYVQTHVDTNPEYKNFILSGDFDKLSKRQLAEYVHAILTIFMMNATVKFDKTIILSEAVSPLRVIETTVRPYSILLYADSIPSKQSDILKEKNAQIKSVFYNTELVISNGVADQNVLGSETVLFSKDLLN